MRLNILMTKAIKTEPDWRMRRFINGYYSGITDMDSSLLTVNITSTIVALVILLAGFVG